MAANAAHKTTILLVDGYNILHAWPRLKSLMSEVSLDAAREELIHLMADYAGFTKQRVIVVFDAHQSGQAVGRHTRTLGIEVIYTAGGETADACIERLALLRRGKQGLTRVATSDFIEQTVVLAMGAVRVSARELLDEVERVREQSRREREAQKRRQRNHLEERLTPEQRSRLEQLRRGRG